MKLGNLTQRLLFAAVAIPVFLWALWNGGWPRYIQLGFIVAAASWEAARMIRYRFAGSGRVTEFVLPIAVLAFAFLGQGGPCAGWSRALPLVGMATILYLILTGFRERSREDAFVWISLEAAAFGFFALSARAIFALSSWGVASGARGWTAAAPLLWVAMACWAGDTGAYAAGKLWGKRKLCPDLSPAKTVEGAIGALVWAVGLSLYWAPRYFNLPLWSVVLAGLTMAVSGILGDLLESSVKRWSEVKDSSQIFPGHGGAFDRFDSLFLAAPLLWAVFVLMQ